MINEKKEFWVRMRDNAKPMLVTAMEDDFLKTGLIRLERLNRDGGVSMVMLNTAEIVSVSENVTNIE